MSHFDDKRLYKALIERDTRYVGVFFVGVKTTGIFCHAICPAKKPKRENCEFFKTAKEALLAGYRPCKKCRPLSNPTKLPNKIQALVDAVEAEPEKRWKDWHFKEIGLDSSTARRQFKKHFNMTFVEYARLRRMGLAMKEIRDGKPVIQGQLSAGYESASGFRDGFSKIFGTLPSQANSTAFLSAKWLETPLGAMLAICDDSALVLLEFTERRGLETEIKKLRAHYNMPIIPAKHDVLDQTKRQISEYFAGQRRLFDMPCKWLGSDFQKTTWQALTEIPYGQTISYKELAVHIGRPSACRAVANANGKNQLAIIVPCHRVIASDGSLGGYGGGISRKQWLLEHERDWA